MSNKKNKKQRATTNQVAKRLDREDLAVTEWLPISDAKPVALIKPPFLSDVASTVSIPSTVIDSNLKVRACGLLNNARHTLIVCTFLLADKDIENAIESAADRGVRVYLMVASEVRLAQEDSSNLFERKCYDEHRASLKRLAGKVLVRTSSVFHAKMILADVIGTESGKSSGMLFTGNLTTAGMERNEEIAVVLSEQQARESAEILKWAFWEKAEHQLIDQSKISAIKPYGKLQRPIELGSMLYTTDHCTGIRDHAMDLIDSAKESIVVSSFSWQKDHMITNALCKKAKAGVRTIVLSRMLPGSMDALAKLYHAHAEVYGFEWLHAKAILTDGNAGMVMSANIQKNGMDQGFEMGIKLHGELALQLRELINEILDRCHSSLQSGMTSDLHRIRSQPVTARLIR